MNKQSKDTQKNNLPEETYTVYTHEGAEPPKEEVRSAKQLSSDEYYEYIEDDRIVPDENT